MYLFKRMLCFCLLLASVPLSILYAESGEHPVLIISSYNPDSHQTSKSISDFMDEFRRLGQTVPIAMENMNCKSFSEAPLWKSRMEQLLSKYTGGQSPSVILLIGQEAWASYLSQEDSVKGSVPVFGALASRNAIILPDDSVNLKTWMPKSVDFFKDFPHSHVEAGFVYEYDVEGNIDLIRKIYPRTRHIAFISDNTYGGVALQAHVVEDMKKYPDLDLILLDGRANTIYTISDKLHSLPPNTVLLIGTWRVDMNDGYFMRNATYTMMEAAGNLPAFTITSLCLGYWAIGGVVPAYRPLGKEIAQKVAYMLSHPDKKDKDMEIIPNEVVMDSEVVKAKNLDISSISGPIEMVNESQSFYTHYRYFILGISMILCFLIIGLLVSLYFYYRTKKLKDELEESEQFLREAKDRAEESNRLKSAFLANISHEIRTPLNAIVGFSDVLVSNDYSGEEKDSYVNIIKFNSHLLLHLIDDVLDLSRLESGKVTFKYEKCDVVGICRYAILSAKQTCKKNNEYTFNCRFYRFELFADAQRLQQVLTNLLSNADKFTENGSIILAMEVDEDRKAAVFSITDTGCGIPLDKREFVFERFEKLNEYIQGTGLGLSICKLSVENWGGKIWIDPEYTGGTRFLFTIPLDIE